MTHDMLLQEAARLGITEINANTVAKCAIGRLFRLGSRAEQPGDIEQYENLRRVMLVCADVLHVRPDTYKLQPPPR